MDFCVEGNEILILKNTEHLLIGLITIDWWKWSRIMQLGYDNEMYVNVYIK